MIGRLVSEDQSGDHSFDVPVKDPLAGMARAGGDYPWRLDNGYSTIVHLKNVLDKPVQAVVQIRYAGGTHNPERISLQAHQTIAIDIAAMRDVQKADIRNSVMPKDVTTGQVIWWELTPGSLIGRAEVSNARQGVVSSFSCGTGSCPVGFNGASVSPGSMTAVVGGSGSFLAQETDRDCFGSLFGPYGVNATWSSSNTSVVTVNSSGSASCVGPGTAGLTATWFGTIYNCDPNFNCSTTAVHASPAASVTVVLPQLAGRFQSLVPNDSNPNETISGQTFTLQVLATIPNSSPLKVDGNFNGPVQITFPTPLISGESISQNPVQLTAGSGTTNITLKVIDNTPSPTASRSIHMVDTRNPAFATPGALAAAVWFNVIATDEGDVNGTTACGHTIVANDHFVALPATELCNTVVMLRSGTNSSSTTVLDVGPWFPHSAPTSLNPCVGPSDEYWFTSGIPRAQTDNCSSNGAGIDLADGTFADLQLSGPTRILWRFGH